MREMTDAEITAKHIRVRGSEHLKYPPDESQCHQRCGIAHDEYRDARGNPKYKEHRCFLGVNHKEGYCQFSSECGERRVKPARVAVTLTVDEGVAA